MSSDRCFAGVVLSTETNPSALSALKEIVTGSRLYFERITREDSGDYTCTARNGVGKPIEKTISVIISSTHFSQANECVMI